ncbi:MAG: MMPL family transporter [Planctomycetes bacterium]|nr:MMPL family transporter [Planctomycetota bacterium]
MKVLSHLLEKRRALLVALVVGLSLLALARLPGLRFDAVVRGFYADDDADYARLLEVFRTFGSDDLDALLLVEAPDVLAPQAVEAQRELARAARALPGIASAVAATDVPSFGALGLPRPLFPRLDAPATAWAAARAAALAHPLIAGQLVAPSGKLAAILVHLSLENPSVEEMAPIVARLDEIASRVAAERGVAVHLSGVPAVRTEIYGAMRRDQERFLVVGAAIGFALLYAVFRSLAATFVAALCSWLAVLWALGALAWANEPLNLLSAALPTLVLVVAFADAVHLLSEVRFGLARGETPRHAASVTLRHLGGACFVTSFTTVVGFASLAATSIPIIQRFGIACAAGTALAFLAIVTSVPLLASIERVGRALRPRAGVANEPWGAHPLLQRAIERCLALALRWPRAIAIGGFALTASAVWVALGLEPENSIRENLPRGGRAERALDLVDRELGGILSLSVVARQRGQEPLDAPALIEVLEEVERACAVEPQLSRAFSALNIVRTLPGSGPLAQRVQTALAIVPSEVLARCWSGPERSALLSVRVMASGTRAVQPMLERLQAQLRELERAHPKFSLELTGTPVVAGANLNQMIVDLAKSLGSAAFLIFLAMAAAFRSWRLGFISILPNALPMLITAAALSLGGGSLELSGVITFSICLGIAVDDTTHVLARFRREWLAGFDSREALERTMRGVGLPMVTTTLVFLGGFGTLALSSLPGLRQFGLLAVVAMTTALLCDLILLPALLLLGAPRRRSRPPQEVEAALAVGAERA